MPSHIIDIEDSVMARCKTNTHSGDKRIFQVTPHNTFSIANAPNDTWNAVIRKIQHSPNIVEYEIYCPTIATNCEPGQFVIVRASERSERIPLTIADFSREDGTITIVVQTVGHSSKVINGYEEGDRFLDLVGPLGHKSVIKNFGTIVCVAGGLGVAPIYPIQRALKEAGNHVISIYGSRNRELLFWQDKMAACADEVYVATDDGSFGAKGFVTNVLQRLIDEGKHFNRCISIGPGIMMRNTCAVTKREPRTDEARDTNCLPIPTIVSLNTIMVDGTGMCGACRVRIGDTTKFACVDGPEFDGHQVDWDGIGVRMRSYYGIEKQTAPKARTFGVRVPMPELPADFRRANFMEVALGYTEELAQAEAARCLQCPKPRCRKSCPVSVDIPNFIKKIRERDYHGAYDIIRQNNPCPGITGRVCPQEVQCESTCVLGERGLNRGAIAIGRLERFVADYVRRNQRPESQTTIPHSGCRVAVVGSGPAGIAAAAGLAQRGHRVTIFEALHKAGGVCAFGIPSFRLPKDLVQHEINMLRTMEGGQLVDIRLNTPIGPCGSVPELMANGYDAAFVGTGAGLPYFTDLPGEDLPGVYSANEYLTRITLMRSDEFPFNSDTPVLKAKNVVVIGGGNVACDVARCARRLGANVTMVYRRTLARMPARREEIHHALQEGVKVKECFSPIEFIGNCEGDGLKGVLSIQMDNSDPSKRPTPIPGTEELVPAGLAVIAIGQGPNPLLTKNWPELQVNKRGNIVTDSAGMTNISGVFAGGDIVTGAATVIKALGAGRTAAKSIDEWLTAHHKGSASLRGLPVRGGLPVSKSVESMSPIELKLEKIRLRSLPPSPKAVKPLLPAPQMDTNTPAKVVRIDSTSECIRIDTTDCCACGACVDACSDQSMGINVLEIADDGMPQVRGAITLKESNCIGCGSCSRVCPVSAIKGAPSMTPVLEAIKPTSGKAIRVALVAPSAKVGVFEALYGQPGNGQRQMISGLRNMGFDRVFDVQTAADMTIMEESAELLGRVKNGNLPLFTSCCPAWVRLVEQEYPALVPHLSSARSPQAMAAATARLALSKELGVEPSDVYIASLMPCTAKKGEIRRKQLDGDCDHVVTVREFVSHVKDASISTEHQKPVFDDLMGTASGAASLFGGSGGVMESAIRSVATKLGSDWSGLDLTPIQGSEAIREAHVKVGDQTLRVCVASGGANIRAVLNAMETGARHYDFVEFMACPGGCVGGAGMPRCADEKTLQERQQVLRKIDSEQPTRCADHNAQMTALYNEVLGDRAHELLHTTFAQ
eukprot:gnl/Dysnectes_brevis/2290_a2692_1327.p1 GENE.gnl/Dysnectes_brevis/2290_a2692_1327~~gnl/Dysnectes_brevis/2290_a2692_1327.p1  ORF type:complete len:1285 (+),score=400.42 gnl/Dysnectes_brevis/2290_a2692_1327:189-4043(+)